MITSAAAAEYENLLRGNSLHIKLNDDDILHLAMCLPPLPLFPSSFLAYNSQLLEGAIATRTRSEISLCCL